MQGKRVGLTVEAGRGPGPEPDENGINPVHEIAGGSVWPKKESAYRVPLTRIRNGAHMEAVVVAVTLAVSGTLPKNALAWGDNGHKIIALIAEHFPTLAARTRVDALLAADTDNLTKHDIANEATSADKYRDSNNRRDHYAQTQQWHFVDMEIENADIA